MSIPAPLLRADIRRTRSIIVGWWWLPSPWLMAYSLSRAPTPRFAYTAWLALTLLAYKSPYRAIELEIGVRNAPAVRQAQSLPAEAGSAQG